jgi:amino acid transporter
MLHVTSNFSPEPKEERKWTLVSSDAEGAVLDEDDKALERMGYKSELYRGLSSFSNFAFGFTEVNVLCSFVSMYGYGLATGGPAVIIWGFLVTFMFNTVVAYSMAEICSAYPSAGSVYHWTGQLVPSSLAPVASYTCGWSNFLGNAAGDAAFSYTWATFFSASIAISGGSALSQQMLCLTSIVVLLLWSLLNFFRIDTVGSFNHLAVFAHVGAIIFILLACFTVATPLESTEWVFTSFVNDTGFASDSYVIIMGLLTGVYCFTGFEASAHMAEETQGAKTSAPDGVINTVLATGAGGLLVIIPVLYATSSVEGSLHGDSGNAVVDAVTLSMNTRWACVFAWAVTVNLFFAGVSSVAVTGRITWALMRDNGFFFSDYFKVVDEGLQSPIRAIMFVFAFDALLLLLPLNPGVGLTAFYSIVGLCAVGFNISYAIPIGAHIIYSTETSFPRTEKSLGSYSRIFGSISCVWLLFTAVLFFLPTEYPVTNENMNWLCVVAPFVLLVGYLNWIFNSQYSFTGPRRTERDGPQKPLLANDM